MLNLATINVNGFKDFFKRAKAYEIFRTKNLDIIFLQETHAVSKQETIQWTNQWGGKAFWSLATSNGSKGTAILFRPNYDFSVKSYNFDQCGRLVVLDIVINNIEFRLISVYAPNIVKGRKIFFNQLFPYLVCNKYVVLAGDFNCVENIFLDKCGGNANYGDQGAELLFELKNDFDLFDAFRHLHSQSKEYTWFAQGKDIKERLDRFYLSKQMVNFLSSVKHIDFGISDHSLVIVTLDKILEQSKSHGEGYWKCNVSILNKPGFLEDFSVLWDELILQANSNFTTEWWDMAKTAFKTFIIEKSKLHAQQFRHQLNRLEEKLNMLNDFNLLESGNFENEIEIVKAEIDNLLQEKVTGSIIRSKARVLDNNEKPTKFFLRKEQVRAKAKSIDKLETQDGVISEPEAILNECRNFYSELYAEQPVDHSLIDYFLKDMSILSDMDRESCEGSITKEECILAISKMKNGKSPGLDGLPKEFYAKVFPIIGDVFVEIINKSFKDGILCSSQRHGLITLLCKDHNNAEKLSNWRPISLLNVDYKIISKVLTGRLSGVLSRIIHIDQTCAVPGRSILDNVHLIRNIFDFTNFKDLPCALISLDQSKAFDRVSHEFMFKTLEACGFGPDFINWVRLLYNGSKSSILANGFVSESFPVKRSVRQGCSLSPLLYVLCMESFAIKIRQDNHICGLRLPGSDQESRLSQYADDTTCVVTTTQSISKILVISELYSLASGALLNKSKSCAIWLGKWRNHSNNLYGLKWVKSIKICGVYFSDKDTVNENWDPILSKMAKTVDLFKSRSMSVFGKAVVSNIVLCSKLWYMASVVDIPPLHMDRCVRMIFSFIWSDQTERVSRKTLYLNPEKGGLNVTHVHSKIKALKVKHILNLINGDYAKWHSLAIYWIGQSIAMYKPEYGSNLIPHSNHIPVFYKSCLQYFREYLAIIENKRSVQATSQNANGALSVVTKVVYETFLDKVNLGHVPHVLSVHPNIDFSLGWTANLNNFLDPSLRDLTWKILHNVVPVQAYLHKLNISRSLACPHCMRMETLIHAFYQCPHVSQVWSDLLLFMEKAKIQFPESLVKLSKVSMEAVVFNLFPLDVLKTNHGQVSLYFVSEMRSAIWGRRCAKLKENKASSVKIIFQHFLKFVRNRVRTDFSRMDVITFYNFWCVNSDLIKVGIGEAVINF